MSRTERKLLRWPVISAIVGYAVKPRVDRWIRE